MRATTDWDGHSEGREDPNSHAELVRLSEWGMRPISWLWEPLIPRRKVTLLVGEQEKGKTFFALDLAARLSWGELIPPAGRFDEGPVSTLILSGDDDLDDTLYPRLEKLGADLDRIFMLTANGPRNIADFRPQITLADSVESLNRAARRIGDCRLIIIDPITAFLEGMGTNSHSAVRRLLGRLAKAHHAAVLVITHHRKEGADGVLHRTIGSLAFTVASRVVLTLVDDPTTAGRRLLLPAKMNLRPIAQCPGRAFYIDDGMLHWDLEPVGIRPDELQRLAAKGLATSDRLLDVIERLRALLDRGSIPSQAIHEWAAEQRIPRLLLFQAKDRIGVQARRDGTAQRWYWELLAQEEETENMNATGRIPVNPLEKGAIPPPHQE